MEKRLKEEIEMAKTQAERIIRLETYYIEGNERLLRIEQHLADINGAVAENTRFRIQVSAYIGLAAVAWASIFVPLLTVLATIFLR